MIDGYIITNALASLLIFFILHVLILRNISHEQVFRWLSRITLLSGFIGWFSGLIFQLIFVRVSTSVTESFIIIPFFASVLYGLAVVFFILCVFGVTTTSIRMKLLMIIYKAGKKGILVKELAGIYNRVIIVGIRLRRLTGSGQLILKDGRYHVSGKPSAVYGPALIFRYFMILYGATRRVS